MLSNVETWLEHMKMHFCAAHVASERRAAFVQYHTDEEVQGPSECASAQRSSPLSVFGLNSNGIKASRCMLEPCARCSRRRFWAEWSSRQDPAAVNGSGLKFINGFVNISALFYRLLEKGAEWEWFKACQTAFDALMHHHTSAPIPSICSARWR
ncbi:hypothetical protein T02_7560 [Trichinella nativa]|uniref:Uncharacterized protein n=1 Tax=Trichinella nativa TaxID=6335 RepID=A0A0V1KZY5_9BILA|nr:hypothetical protein T02_7560 [Trichinella nativa]